MSRADLRPDSDGLRNPGKLSRILQPQFPEVKVLFTPSCPYPPSLIQGKFMCWLQITAAGFPRPRSRRSVLTTSETRTRDLRDTQQPPCTCILPFTWCHGGLRKFCIWDYKICNISHKINPALKSFWRTFSYKLNLNTRQRRKATDCNFREFPSGSFKLRW